jgi:hypothetical protein
MKVVCCREAYGFTGGIGDMFFVETELPSGVKFYKYGEFIKIKVKQR